jgi:TatD DNase family protein
MLDAHVHLDRYQNPSKIARAAGECGVLTIAVTNLPSHFMTGLSYVRSLPLVKLALGLHPLLATHHEHERRLFYDSLLLTSFIGEVGLDFSREGKSTRNAQVESFRFVVKSISVYNKVVSLHSRGAESAVLDILKEYRVRYAIFHWYTGPFSVLDEAVSDGHFFSVNPAMVRSERGKQIIAKIPPNRLLTETDGPLVKISRMPAHPWDVAIVEKHLSQVWNVEPEEVRNRVWSNFQQILHGLNIQIEGR